MTKSLFYGIIIIERDYALVLYMFENLHAYKEVICMKIIKKEKTSVDANSNDVFANTLEPLVNPSMEEAKTFKFDRSVIFDDVEYSVQWLEEAMRNED